MKVNQSSIKYPKQSKQLKRERGGKRENIFFLYPLSVSVFLGATCNNGSSKNMRENSDFQVDVFQEVLATTRLLFYK